MKTCTSNKKQSVLITGAAGGLGKAFAVECARRGWDLFLTDMAESPVKNLACSLENVYRVKTTCFTCNLADASDRGRLINELRSNHAVIHMLINVAGIDHEGLFLNQSLSNLQTMVRVNVESPLALMHEAIKLRDPQTTFRVINVCSMAAFYPMPVKATYAASKRFLLDLSQALRLEFAQENATVTALCPAGMPTNPPCIQSIDAQGWAGYITTMNTGKVAYETIEAAFKGKAVVVPGAVNRFIQLISSFVPTSLKIRYIAGRWLSVRSKRIVQGELSSI